MAVKPIETANKTISAARLMSGSAIVFFSCGKDSIALLDMVAPVFDRVVCVFMYFVPGMKHTDRYLNDAKRRYPNVEIMQVEHFAMTSARKYGVYCLPNPKQRLSSLGEIDEQVRQKTGISISFYGSKKNDGLNRRLMLNSYGELPIQQKTQKYYPLADFSNKEVLAYIKAKRLATPIRYSQKQSNALGFNLECFLWMQKNEPQDLQLVYKHFPMSRQILFEHEYKEKRTERRAKALEAAKVRSQDDSPKRTEKRAVQSKENK